MHRFCVALLSCFLLLTSSGTFAQQATDKNAEQEPLNDSEELERKPIPDDAELGFVRRSIIIVDDAQRVASERFGGFIGQIDGFFSNADSADDAVSNGSWARIRLEGVRANGEDFELDQSVKLRAVLPNTERKLKLLVSTEDDNSSDVDEVLPNSSQQGEQNASLALRFIRTARENSDVNFDVGVRQRDGDVQTFVRLNAHYNLDIGEKWSSKIANRYQNYSKSGYENKISFSFRRQLYAKNNLNFRTYTEFGWSKGRKGAAIGHTTGLYWQLGDYRALALEGLAGYNTSLNGSNDRFLGHQFRIRWRDSLGRPWLFYEIWPSVAWPSTTRYERTKGILVRLEVIIGYRD